MVMETVGKIETVFIIHSDQVWFFPYFSSVPLGKITSRVFFPSHPCMYKKYIAKQQPERKFTA